MDLGIHDVDLMRWLCDKGVNYIDTARAKGLRQLGVIVRHGLRNAVLPVITMRAVQLSSLLSGAVICEKTMTTGKTAGRMTRSAPHFNERRSTPCDSPAAAA